MSSGVVMAMQALSLGVTALAVGWLVRRRWMARGPAGWKAVAVAIVLCFAVLAVVEWGLGVEARNHPTVGVPDAVLIWKLNPGVHLSFDGSPSWSLTVNSLGFRGPELSPASAGAGVRVGVVGDSALFGEGVSDDETFCPALQRQLRRRLGRDDVEVVNLAVPGWTSFQAAWQLQEVGPGLDLDAVVVGFNNGPESSALTERERSLVDSPLLWLHRLLYRRQIYLRLRGALAGPRDIEADQSQATTQRVPPDEHARYLGEISDFCSARHIPALFLVLPHNPDPKGRAAPVPVYRDLVYEAAVGQSLLDVDRLWKRQGQSVDDFLPNDGVHFNPRGTERIAGAVAAALLPLLPADPGK